MSEILIERMQEAQAAAANAKYPCEVALTAEGVEFRVTAPDGNLRSAVTPWTVLNVAPNKRLVDEVALLIDQVDGEIEEARVAEERRKAEAGEG